MGPEKVDVVVIGGGISGLCAAYWLNKQNVSVRVLEKESEVGGTMKSISEDGFLIETGPNSALETTPLIQDLVRENNLSDQFLYANPAGKNRYILRDGKLYPLPLSPVKFLTSKLFSWSAKVRLLKELSVERVPHEETVAEFVTRRLGKEFLDYAIDPFVAGIYAALPEQLSVRAAFPKLHALEEQYGGLIKGMIQGRKERKKREERSKNTAETFSFKNGMQTLPYALGKNLGERVRCSTTVTQLRDLTLDSQIPQDEKDTKRYSVEYLLENQTHEIEADSVILSTPAYVTAQLVHSLSQNTSKVLQEIPYSPVVSIFLGYAADDVPHPLDGFGFLVPSLEKRNILGCLWSSSLFPGRAPEKTVALTVFAGGLRNPELFSLDDRKLLEIVTKDLSSIMHISGKPLYLKITRWSRAIPQYIVGYHKYLDRLSEFEETHPGIYSCSNYRGGISVGDCITSSKEVADRVLAEMTA